MIEHFFIADYFLFFCHIYIYIFVEHFWKIRKRFRLRFIEDAGVKSPDKNFRVMTKTSFRNKTSRRSNSVGGDRAHRVIVAESYSGRLASYREHVCCWNKKGGEKRWKNEEREI